MERRLDSNLRQYRLIAWAGSFILAGAIVYLAVQQKWAATAVLAMFLVISIGIIARRSRLPTLFEAIFVVAVVVNAAGYAWNFYKSVGFYDELAHLYTGFAVTLALGFLLYEELMDGFRDHRVMFVVTITGLGMATGALWEIFEWLYELATGYDMVGTVRDTMTDLVLDSAGAFAAALLNLNGLNER